MYPDGTCYPCTISHARYGGTYEGGRWVAYPYGEIPEDAQGGDPECMAWFEEHGWSVGAGATPDEAAAHLINQLEAAALDGRALLTRLVDTGLVWVAEEQLADHYKSLQHAAAHTHFIRPTRVRYVSDDPQPGIVEVDFVDAAGAQWTVVDKTAIFSMAIWTRESGTPDDVRLGCFILRALKDDLVEIELAWNSESTTGETVFTMNKGQLRER